MRVYQEEWDEWEEWADERKGVSGAVVALVGGLLVVAVVLAGLVSAGLLTVSGVPAVGPFPVRGRASAPSATPGSSRIPVTPYRTFPSPPLSATAATLLDAESGRILFERNAHAERPMASTTKIMTAIVVLEATEFKPQAALRVPAAAAQLPADSSLLGLQEGEEMSGQDLLYAMLLPSANDAAETLAIRVAGNEAAFVLRMNRKAAQLGLRDTHYVVPTGYPTPGHYSSAADLARLARYALQNRRFAAVVGTRAVTIHGRMGGATGQEWTYPLSNVNYFLSWYPGADGVKPGWDGGAGICQVVSAHRHGQHLIGVVLNTPTLYQDVRALMDYGFRDFSWIPAPFAGDTPGLAVPTQDGGGRYYLYTGQAVSGPFLTYVDQGGAGLDIVGYPRTQPLDRGQRVVQYFSRQVLVLDRATGKVSAVSLGKRYAPADLSLTATQAIQRRFLSGPRSELEELFRAYTQAHGGQTLIGLPLSAVLEQGGVQVQYFERGALAYYRLPDTGRMEVVSVNLGDRELARLWGECPAGDPPAPLGCGNHTAAQVPT